MQLHFWIVVNEKAGLRESSLSLHTHNMQGRDFLPFVQREGTSDFAKPCPGLHLLSLKNEKVS